MAAAVAVPLITAGIGAGTTAYGAYRTSKAAKDAANATTSANNHAADLEAQSAREALDFTKQQEETRRREWQATQDRNFQIWQNREQQLQPFRDFGTGALAQLAAPVYKPGSLGDRMGGN